MESMEDAPEKDEKKIQTRDSPVLKVDERKITRIRKLKVNCMSETELSTYHTGTRQFKVKKQRRVAQKSKYQSHYVKKTVKNTFKSLPQSPAEQAEVLSKLAELALRKLEEQSSKQGLRVHIKIEGAM